MRFEKRLQAFAQLSGAMPVHDADFLKIGDQRIVEESRHTIDGLIDRHPDHIQLAKQAFARLEVDVDPYLSLWSRTFRSGDHPQLFGLRLDSLPANVNFCAVPIQ